MNYAQLLCLLDGIAFLTCFWCFDAMAPGRKMLLGEYDPEPAPSEVYAAQSDWRR